MAQMICSKCHKFGIYWKNLGTINEYTYCPNCQGINCQALEIEEKKEEEENNGS
jgi:hypothetical protein